MKALIIGGIILFAAFILFAAIVGFVMWLAFMGLLEDDHDETEL